MLLTKIIFLIMLLTTIIFLIILLTKIIFLKNGSRVGNNLVNKWETLDLSGLTPPSYSLIPSLLGRVMKLSSWRNKWRCPWRNAYRRRKWTRRHEFHSWARLIAFHIALIPLGKVWIQLFSLQLWVNSRAD